MEIRPVLLAIILANNAQAQAQYLVRVVMLLNFEQMMGQVAVNV
jgi:hypothetical protein